MSNQQWPGQDPSSPWARQDPDWRPQQFQDHAGRDPRQPFGQSAEVPSMPDLEPPRKPFWGWVIGALVVIVGLLAFLLFQPEQPSPVASEQPPPSAFPSPTITGNALPYEGNGTGVLEVTSHTWRGDELTINYRLTTDEGTRRFAFFAFLNDTRESYLAVDDHFVEVSAGSPKTGSLTFPMPRGDTTFVLTTTTGRAITALPIPG